MRTPFLRSGIHALVASGTMLLSLTGLATVAAAQDAGLMDFASPSEPPIFDDPAAAIEAFASTLKKDDFAGLANILGLDAEKLKASEGVTDTYAQIRAGVDRRLVVRDLGDRQELDIGDQLWPFPFPLTKGTDGKWAFDTYAGIEEIINRRIGENEIEAVDTARAYVDAQRDYAAEDRDGDGVLEYTQKLISSDGQADGLYWPVDAVHGASPAGEFLDQAALDKAKAGSGYFGYRFRILTAQGDNIAGGAYDYVINDNMIAGFALLAWPVKYGETGVSTFAVNHQGIVYEIDLGPDTEMAANSISQFNPDDKWQVTDD